MELRPVLAIYMAMERRTVSRERALLTCLSHRSSGMSVLSQRAGTHPNCALDTEMFWGPFGACSPVETSVKELLRGGFYKDIENALFTVFSMNFVISSLSIRDTIWFSRCHYVLLRSRSAAGARRKGLSLCLLWVTRHLQSSVMQD